MNIALLSYNLNPFFWSGTAAGNWCYPVYAGVSAPRRCSGAGVGSFTRVDILPLCLAHLARPVPCFN